MDAHRFDSPHAPALRGSSDGVTAVTDITDRAAVRVPNHMEASNLGAATGLGNHRGLSRRALVQLGAHSRGGNYSRPSLAGLAGFLSPVVADPPTPSAGLT